MSGFLKLPCELVAAILRQVDTAQHLLSARLACRHINNALIQQSGLPVEILRREINSELLPYALATLRCSRKTVTLELCKSTLQDLHEQPHKLLEDCHKLRSGEASKLSQMHQMITDLARKFANTAWAKMDQGQTLVLSIPEEVRFCRAFYRFELLCAYSRVRSQLEREPSYDPDSPIFTEMRAQLLAPYPPWANEQLGCATEFLAKTLLESIRGAVAHEVQFGEYSIDYLSLDADNFWLHDRLSHGIQSIHQLLECTSKHQKVDLIQPQEDDLSRPSAIDVLCPQSVEGGAVPLVEYSAAELEALIPVQRLADADNGPYDAWYQIHKDDWNCNFLMYGGYDGLRERAYVFWDSERLRRHGLTEHFQNVEEYSTSQPTDSEREEMYRSFEERSKIWQKGGRGFWYDGDESEIVWPKRG
ncbi:Hypothetical predicted protein [Lecanosticta acicola]|uniref:F-box domain-containing protein n=1 Tax=Lecanosticta acicola TaxID=111012 RepID=A0AAI9EE30_9PEZI|nr:Hypothetical predicted protein [Lecanosticta acicola]